MFAHFFKSKAGAELVLSSTPALNTGEIVTVKVADKREARAVATAYKAKCWNF